MKIKFSLNPTTRKRIQRFCAIKRAYYSFWTLLIFYVVSLFAYFYCNNKPLLIHFNDQYYFPMLSDYKKKDFSPLEDNTLVNYKSLKKTPLFLENKNNYMVFPPIPFGQEENIELSELTISRDITLNIESEPKVGSIDINEDLTIRKIESPEYFFEENQEFKKLPLSNFIEMTTELKTALESRFANQPNIEFIQTKIGRAHV